MKVFISWSGPRSLAVAEALRDWIPYLFPTVTPFVSKRDIGSGERWGPTLTRELEETKFGILCLTQDNNTESWLLFEAGALSKTVAETFVCPYLIGFESIDLPGGPLTQFQARVASERDTFALMKTLNSALTTGKRRDSELEHVFERFWPDLDEKIRESAGAEIRKPRRTIEDMVAETLEIVRGLARRPAQPGIGEALREAAYARLGLQPPASESFSDIASFLKGNKPSDILMGREAIDDYGSTILDASNVISPSIADIANQIRDSEGIVAKSIPNLIRPRSGIVDADDPASQEEDS